MNDLRRCSKPLVYKYTVCVFIRAMYDLCNNAHCNFRLRGNSASRDTRRGKAFIQRDTPLLWPPSGYSNLSNRKKLLQVKCPSEYRLRPLTWCSTWVRLTETLVKHKWSSVMSAPKQPYVGWHKIRVINEITTKSVYISFDLLLTSTSLLPCRDIKVTAYKNPKKEVNYVSRKANLLPLPRAKGVLGWRDSRFTTSVCIMYYRLQGAESIHSTINVAQEIPKNYSFLRNDKKFY